jgi:hypothetical protein
VTPPWPQALRKVAAASSCQTRDAGESIAVLKTISG